MLDVPCIRHLLFDRIEAAAHLCSDAAAALGITFCLDVFHQPQGQNMPPTHLKRWIWCCRRKEAVYAGGVLSGEDSVGQGLGGAHSPAGSAQ